MQLDICETTASPPKMRRFCGLAWNMIYIHGTDPTEVVPVAPVGWRVVAWLGAVVGPTVGPFVGSSS
jgi:hypothetical protein